jgi:thiamine-phosphate pyrophosphorylase
MLQLTCNDYLLYLVTDSILCSPRSLEKVVLEAIQGGVNLVQLRAKTATTVEVLKQGKKLQEILKPNKIPLIINDRIDIALALKADGVHLGPTDMPFKLARKILGQNKIIGLTINNFEQAILAENFDVDYLGVGPVFQTKTKQDCITSWRIDELRKLRQISRHKLVAIGGINERNIGEVVNAGVDGVAVISAICCAKNPKQSALNLINKMRLVGQ